MINLKKMKSHKSNFVGKPILKQFFELGKSDRKKPEIGKPSLASDFIWEPCNSSIRQNLTTKNQKSDFIGKPSLTPDFIGKPSLTSDFIGKPILGPQHSFNICDNISHFLESAIYRTFPNISHFSHSAIYRTFPIVRYIYRNLNCDIFVDRESQNCDTSNWGQHHGKNLGDSNFTKATAYRTIYKKCDRWDIAKKLEGIFSKKCHCLNWKKSWGQHPKMHPLQEWDIFSFKNTQFGDNK